MSAGGCRLQELLRRPIFPSLSLLPPTASFTTTSDTLNPHLSQILANSEHRLNLAQQRIQQLHSQQQQQQQQHVHQQPSSCQIQQPKRRYSCTQCPYSTDRRDLFRRHENIHRDEKPFRCYVCNKMFNRADHVKKHFLRIHKGLQYDVKLTKRVKGVDYDVKDAFERNITLNSPANGSQLSNNSNVNNANLNVPNLNHVSNCNGNVGGVFNRTVNVSVNINGNSSNQHQNVSENKCFTLFPPHPYIYSNGIHLASNLASLNNLKDDNAFRSETESVSLLSNVQANNELSSHFNVVQSNENKLNGESNVYASVENLSDESEESEDENDINSDFECEYCGCAFVNYPSLHTHRYLLHRHVSDTDAISLYRCVICDRKCITQRAMMKHMLTHTGRFAVQNRLPNTDCEQRVFTKIASNESKSKQLTSNSMSTSSRRKQSQPKKIVKSSVNVVEDMFEFEKCDKICLSSKFNCKICHKHFSTYTQLIQHQMFFKHYH